MTEQQTNIENFMVTVENNLGTTLAAKAAALPDGFQPAKFQQNCVAMLKTLKKADLVKIKPQDIVACLMKAALLDLDFSTGECYALPYWNKEEGKNDLNFQTDYKGEKKVAETYSIKPIANIIQEIVREGDEYQKIVQGGNVSFVFKPIPFNDKKIVGAFAQVTYKDGSSIGDEINIVDLEKLRKDFSKAPNSPAWTKTPGEMYKKVILRRVLKNVPKSFKNSAQSIAYSTCTDFEFNNSTGVTTKAEEIRNPFLTTQENVPQLTAQKNDSATVEMPQNEFSEPEAVIVPSETEQAKTEASEVPIEVFYECANCASQITEAEDAYSRRNYGRPLCRQCQALAKQGEI